jgi:hypothetical protein
VLRPEKVDQVEVGNVDSVCVGHGRIGAVLLNLHGNETDIYFVNFLNGQNTSSMVREGFAHLASVDKSSFYSGLDFNCLVTTENDRNVDVACITLFLLQEVVDMSRDVGTQLGGWKQLGTVWVLCVLGVLDLVKIVTRQAMFPDIFVV